MKILRITNKQTGVFLRDDFTFNEETEIGLEVNPAQGFYLPKWDGEQWIEGATTEEIEALAIIISEQIKQPTIESRITNIEQVTEEVITILNDKGIAP